MRRRVLSVIGILIISVLVFSIQTIAKSGLFNLAAEYADIKIYYDKKEFIPRNVNGTYVEPFIIEGTTYVPIRAVSQLFNNRVDWDGNTHSVLIAHGDGFYDEVIEKLKPGVIYNYCDIDDDNVDELIVYDYKTYEIYARIKDASGKEQLVKSVMPEEGELEEGQNLTRDGFAICVEKIGQKTVTAYYKYGHGEFGKIASRTYDNENIAEYIIGNKVVSYNDFTLFESGLQANKGRPISTINGWKWSPATK